jgi:AcrR family transcriptional regulator
VKQTYHHGDLRQALLEEALRMLADEGPTALTMRELGRRLGVTHAAVYGHFPDKGALLDEVAEIGFSRLAGACAAAREAAPNPRAGFAAMGHTYLTFARSSPHLYRLMFADEALAEADDCAEMPPEGEGAFAQLVGVVTDLTGFEHERAREASLAVWAGVHGLAMLELDQRIGKVVQSLSDPLAIVTAVLLNGVLRYDSAAPGSGPNERGVCATS